MAASRPLLLHRSALSPQRGLGQPRLRGASRLAGPAFIGCLAIPLHRTAGIERSGRASSIEMTWTSTAAPPTFVNMRKLLIVAASLVSFPALAQEPATWRDPATECTYLKVESALTL